ncbi:phage protease [Zoogloea sp.]|uniref:phage protease n=1 Tax=Zoogloea sp. TaxID=49181 RepID=UPI002608C667|nr:phage protease [Zoogloea sp.]
MPPNTPTAAAESVALAALVFEIDAGATEAHLLPPGPFRAVDGRPIDVTAWQLDAAIAGRVITRQRARSNDTLIDFEHQSLRARENGKRVEAAGWFRDLEWREGRGLYATSIRWVGDTAQLIADRKVRYVSTVFLYSGTSGEVLEILSFALTNTPALDGLDALAELARSFLPTPPVKEPTMTPEQIAALSTERDTLKSSTAALTAEVGTLKASVAALTTERDTLQASVAAAAAEKVTAALAAEKQQHTDLVTAALGDGRLPPTLKGWAEKQSLAALTEFLGAAAPLAAAGGRQGGGAPAGKGLTAEETAMCSRMGVSADEYAKAKA